MAAKKTAPTRNTLTIYFPQKHRDKNVITRLQKLAEAKDRSVNYLAVQAIVAYLEQAEDAPSG